MDEKLCFAYKSGKCIALTVKRCEGEHCSFYKTKAQAAEDQRRVFRRINALDPQTKRNIMDLYYGGKMSLLDDVEVE